MGRRNRAAAEEREPNPMMTETIERAEPFAPVDEDDDDPIADTLDELEDENSVDLDEPEPLGGPQTFTGPNGASYVTDDGAAGRQTSPQLWRAASGHPSVDQLRMYKLMDGRPTAIGDIDSQASELDFHRRFFAVMPKPGEEPAKFKFRPMSNGREILQEVNVPPVHPMHTNLVRLRAGDDPAPNLTRYETPINPMAGVVDLMRVVRELTEPYTQRLEEERKASQAERERVLEERRVMADERMELAGRASSSVEAITERMIAGDGKRAELALNQAQSGFQSMLGVMQQGAAERERAQAAREREDADRRSRERADEDSRRQRDRQDFEERIVKERNEATDKRERERAEADDRRERDRRDWEQKMTQDKIDRDDRLRNEEQRLTREREAEVRRHDAAEKERERQHTARLEEMRVRAQQDREHAERMASLNSVRDKNDSAEGMIEKGPKMLTMFGLEPKEVVERFMGGGSGGIDDYIPVIEGAVSILNNGLTQLAEYAKTRAQTDAAKEMAKNQQIPAGGYAAAIAGPVAPPQHAGPAAGSMLGQPQGAPVMQDAQPIPIVTAIVSNLDLHVQKAAREALRMMVNALRRLTPDKWGEQLTSTVTGNVASYHFLREAGLKPALREAGAEPQLIDAFVTQLTNQQLPILSDIPIDKA